MWESILRPVNYKVRGRMRFAHTHIEKDARTRRYTDIQAHVDIQTYRTEIHTQNSHTRIHAYTHTRIHVHTHTDTP